MKTELYLISCISLELRKQMAFIACPQTNFLFYTVDGYAQTYIYKQYNIPMGLN